MKVCPNCKKELKDTAKFCGGCGQKIEQEVVLQESKKCASCGNTLKASAKFCGKCGAKVESENTPSPTIANGADGLAAGISQLGNSGFIRWTMLPGQLALRISEEEIDACNKPHVAKGIVIQDGTKALFFVNGKFVAELAARSYKFKDLKVNEEESNSDAKTNHVSKRSNGFWGFLRNACETARNTVNRVFQNLSQSQFGDKSAISVVLVRSTEFPLVFNIGQANTLDVRSDIGLHIICKVTNINEFYSNLLLDRKFISFEELQEKLLVIVKGCVNAAVASYSPLQINNNPELESEVLSKLQYAVSGVYSFIEVKKLLNLTAENQSLEALRQMGEELYISEQELVELQRRNDFLNRLQAVNNAQEIREGDLNNSFELDKLKQQNAHDISKESVNQSHELQRSRMDSEFEAAKLKIYEEMELTNDERQKFDMMLAAQRTIREAKSQSDVESALHEFEKSGLFRAEEIDNIKHQISHNAQIRNLNDLQAIEVLTLQNNQALEAQRLDWEILMGNKRLDDELSKKRKFDAYTDERREIDDNYADSRREKDAQYTDQRRQANLDFEKQEQEQQINILKQAQALRMEREEAEHRRSMEQEAAARSHEANMRQAELTADVETKRIYAGMTYEQILAANPDVTPEAASALAKKFEAEISAAQNDKTAELLNKQVEMANQNKSDMVAFMQQMMQQQNAMSLKQMEMMRDASIGVAKQQELEQEKTIMHKNEMLAQQKDELERQRMDANRNQDRMLAGVQSAVTAAGAAFAGKPMPASSTSSRKDFEYAPPTNNLEKNLPNVSKCSHCGAQLDANSSFCDECGNAI